jgi:hypothetical protein
MQVQMAGVAQCAGFGEDDAQSHVEIQRNRGYSSAKDMKVTRPIRADSLIAGWL